MILNNKVILDDIMREIRPAELTLLAGAEQSGKTDLAAEMAIYATGRKGQKALFFSLQYEKEQFISRNIGNEVAFEVDDTPGLSICDMKSKCNNYAQKNGLNIVFIDYFLLMTPSVERFTRVDETKAIICDLKSLAKEIMVDLILFVWKEKWAYEITVCRSNADVKENVTYRFQNEWEEIFELDKRLEERKQDPFYAEWVKEQCEAILNMDLGMD